MLKKNLLSRRTFLKASAATTALVSIGTFEFQSFQRSQAEDSKITVIPSTCNGCSSKCGFYAYAKNGRLWKIKGHKDHPSSKGKICARGHGLTAIAYSADRLTQPVKRISDEQFEPITWEQAYQEIGEKLNSIIQQYGPQTVIYNEDPRPSVSFYSKRFLNAIGSPNYFAHYVVCSNARDTAFKYTLGGVPSADISNSKYILFIGRSYGDGVKPSSMQALSKAKQKGAKVVLVDPRLNNTAPLADEWLAIRPGTDLALVLAMANVLIEEDLYDKDFINKYSIGFEQFKQTVKEYTPKWAEKITGISADKIIQIARDMANLKPHSLIEPSWRGAFGSTYLNGAETGRAVALFNALLGNIQQKGGLIFKSKAHLGKLDENKYPTPPTSKLERIDSAYPLVLTSKGVASIVPEKAKEGKVKAAIIAQTNPVRNYSNPQYMEEGYKKLDLMVVIDVQMSETALVANYVLPEPSYLERDEVINAETGAVAFRQKVIEQLHPNTKPSDQIFTGIAKAMGLGKYFNFTLEELNKALIAPLGISLAEIREKGTIPAGEPTMIGVVPKLKTTSGKVEFYSDAFEQAGFSPVVKWMEPLVMPETDSFRLITGKQGYHSQTFTADIPSLMQITKDYNGERLWINTDRAKALGIKDGDLVEVSSEQATSQIKVKVTERLHPECVYVPSGYGRYSKYLQTANGVGFSYLDHIPYQIDPIAGTSMIHEIIVKVRKVGS